MEKKKQHTVPKCYLDNFVNSRGNLFVLGKNKCIFEAKPHDILTENYFYKIKFSNGKSSFIVEDTLSKIESQFASIFRAKIEKMKSLTDKERGLISVFIASMMIRTKSSRKTMENNYGRLHSAMEDLRASVKKMTEDQKRTLSSLFSKPDPKEIITAKEIEQIYNDIPTFHSRMTLSLLPEIASIIYRMEWNFLIPEDDNENYITSDNPCVMVNPDLEKRFGVGTLGSNPGLAQKSIELSFPISSRIALLAGWKLEYQAYEFINRGIVNQINIRSRRYAIEQIISSDKNNLEEIIKLAKNINH